MLRLRNTIHLVEHALRPILTLLAVAVVTASIPGHARDTWQVDSQLSIARLSLGSGSNALEIGLARVSGDAIFDSNDPTDPSVNLKITPGNATGADYANMSFTSKQSVMTRDGKFIVTGDLSVTRIERSVTMEPNEAYAGPEYSDPTAHTDTREITLVFSDPQYAGDNGTMHFLGTSTVSREDFPQMLDALTFDDWPTILVNDEKCEAPSTVGEDYSGIKCTGTVIASVSNREVPTGVGEDYHGFQPAVTPDRQQATIAIDLKLKQTSAAARVVSVEKPSAAN